MRLAFAALSIVLSLALLIPGITQPVLTINGTIEKAQMVDTGMDMMVNAVSSGSQDSARNMLNMAAGMLGLNDIQGSVEVFHKSRSIMQTVEELYYSGNALVAILVGLFSIIIPTVKLSAMLLVLMPISLSIKQRLTQIMAVIGKWSMADVFVVALIIVYMAGNASAGMGDMLTTHAQFESGFYFFAAYCVFSIISHSLLPQQFDRETEQENIT
ncbi:paraquat-inducible protein A [Shewanella maritima]|uniref:paraquat-inducible protein A n=1 Tax=Shewanella maritima TaxID=2520507 RepID=UPI0037364EA3